VTICACTTATIVGVSVAGISAASEVAAAIGVFVIGRNGVGVIEGCTMGSRSGITGEPVSGLALHARDPSATLIIITRRGGRKKPDKQPLPSS
jgi:hypothetical protein